jgi:DnaJ-class molecular chaperone
MGFDLNLSPGIPDGLAHTLHQEGGYSSVTKRHNDLVIVFRRVQTDALRYDGALDVHVRVPVGLDELLCGFTKFVDVYDDPAGSGFHLASSGYFNPASTELRLPGRGLPRYQQQDRGQLVVKFDVQYPEADAAPKLGRFAEAFARIWKRRQPMAPATTTEQEGAVVCVQQDRAQ